MPFADGNHGQGMITAIALSAVAEALPRLASWQVLRDDEIWVGCTHAEGEPWCRAIGTVDAPPEQVLDQLMRFEDYPEAFTRVGEVERLSDDVVRMTLELPFPFAQREHLARFVTHADGDEIVIGWEPVAHTHDSDAVCLPDYAGEWRLVPDGESTEVHYTWHADLRGDMPTWTLPRARVTQGSEVLAELDASLRR